MIFTKDSLVKWEKANRAGKVKVKAMLKGELPLEPLESNAPDELDEVFGPELPDTEDGPVREKPPKPPKAPPSAPASGPEPEGHFDKKAYQRRYMREWRKRNK